MSSAKHCQCDSCKDGTIHASDCAVHSEPAAVGGPCNCGVLHKITNPQSARKLWNRLDDDLTDYFPDIKELEIYIREDGYRTDDHLRVAKFLREWAASLERL